MIGLVTCLYTVLFLVIVRGCCSHVVEFGGKERITVDLTERKINDENTRITFRFKTINAFGIIIYSKGTQGDYLAIELVQGMLRYQADLGSASETTSRQELIVGTDLDNNKWHSVDITRSRNAVNISVDGKTKKSLLPSSSFTKLNLDDKIFVGGVSKDTIFDLSANLMSRNYIGCLDNLLFDEMSILYKAKYNEKDFRAFGDVSYECHDIAYSPVTFPDYKATIETESEIQKSFFLTLSFRTYIPSSMIVSKISADGKIFLEIRDGKLCLRVESAKITPIKLEMGKNLNDGNWHDIECVVNGEEVSLKLGTEKPLVYKNPALKQVTYDAKYVTFGGGADNILKGMVGCLYRIRVDGTSIDARVLDPKAIKGALPGKCHVINKCWPNPCKNGGECKIDGEMSLCDCRKTLYIGNTCEDPFVQKSCQEYKSLGLEEDSRCFIDPDGSGPVESFEVLCNMTKESRAVAVVKLSSGMKRTKVDSQPLQGTKYYQRMNYGLTVSQIEAMIKESSECRQFVRYECKSSPLLNSPRGPPSVSWINRQGSMENYWGGAPKGSDKCACGVKKNCADATKYCNCDIGDKFWREDSGFLTDKDALPVTAIYFDRHSADSYSTVGDLECLAPIKTTPPTTTTSSGRTTSSTPNSNVVLQRACRPFNARASTTLKPSTKVTEVLRQTEKIVTKRSTVGANIMRSSLSSKDISPITKTVKTNLGKDDGNRSTSAVKTMSKTHDGVTISMSILAVIVISAAIVLVWAIIAVIVIVRRKKRDSQRGNRQDMETEDDEEGTEMCILFRHSKREPPRPTIELRRDSYDSYDSVPTPALEYTQHTGFRQPITTHITLDYARAKKKKNSSAYFCS